MGFWLPQQCLPRTGAGVYSLCILLRLCQGDNQMDGQRADSFMLLGFQSFASGNEESQKSLNRCIGHLNNLKVIITLIANGRRVE